MQVVRQQRLPCFVSVRVEHGMVDFGAAGDTLHSVGDLLGGDLASTGSVTL
jgi:hypothetical protein